jgi:hypothetical protein
MRCSSCYTITLCIFIVTGIVFPDFSGDFAKQASRLLRIHSRAFHLD